MTEPMVEHEWRPCEGVRPPNVKRRYYCRVCHRRGTEREILMTIPKDCLGRCATNGHHPEEDEL